MLDLKKITVARQRRVVLTLIEAYEDKAFMRSMHDKVCAALGEAIRAGQELGGTHSLPPMAVDNATDSVFSGFLNLLGAIDTGMTDKVVSPLPPEQAAKKSAASVLVMRAFPQGSAFISRSMPLQHEAMTQVMDRLRNDEACVAAIRELNLGWYVDHMGAHMAPYGRAVRASDNRDVDALSTAFHGAFRALAFATLAHHDGDADVRSRLLGAYERELEAQRADERASRKRREKTDATAG
jgi:hypothetical protein